MRTSLHRVAVVAIGTGAAMLVCAIWWVACQFMETERSYAIRAAEEDTLNLALTLGEDNALVLREASKLLNRWATDAAEGRLSIPALRPDPDIFAGVAAFDAGGRAAPGSVELGDTGFLQAHRGRAAGAVLVGSPTPERASGRQVVPLSVAYTNSRGELAGAVVAAIRTEALTALYDKAKLGAYGMVALVGVDGAIRVQSKATFFPPGTSMLGSRLLERQRAAPVGHFLTRGVRDGVPRVASYYTLPSFPSLLVMVGRAQAEVLAGHAQAVRGHVTLAAAASVVVVLLAALGLWFIHAQARSMQEIRRTENRYRAIYDHAVEGIFQTTPDGRYISANAAMARIVGYDCPGALVMSTRDVARGYLDPDKRLEFQRTIESQGFVRDFEYQARRRDGAIIWLRENARVVRGEDGEPTCYEGFVTDVTDRKMEEAAREEAARRAREAADELAQLIDSSPDVICVFDADGRFSRVSAASLRILGYASQDLLGKRLVDVTHEDDVPAASHCFRAVAEGHAVRDFETRCIRADGAIAHVLWSATWRGGSGTALWVGRDITESKRVSERLRETLEQMTSGFCALDHEWRIVFANRFTEEVLGKPREALLGRDIWEEVPSLLGTPFEEAYRRAAREGKPAEFTEYLPGLERWFEVRAYPMPQGGLAIYFHDVSERQRALMQLADSERRFERVAFAVSDAVWDWNCATGEIWWSEGLRQLFGYDPKTEMRTREAWSAAIHPDDRERVLASFDQAAASGKPLWVGEYRLCKRDGTHANVEVHASFMRDQSGAVIRVVGGINDVTERMELVRAQRLQSLGTLASGIAHDLNNVFTPVLMGLDLLDKDRMAPADLQVVEMVRGSVARGAEMVRQVLQFARGGPGAKAVVDLAAAVGETERILRETFPRTLRLDVRCAANMPAVVGDSTQLQQVLLNLCVNARDAMPNGGDLCVEARELATHAPVPTLNGDMPPGLYAVLEVRDTGCGMEPAVLDKIFEPFFTTKEQGRGTGLGLSTTLSIVRRHKGYLQVESAPGRGSRFSVYLPVQETAGVDRVANAVPVAPVQSAGEKILLVDDEPGIRELARRSLEAAGYRVVTAVNGAEALEVAKRERFDAVVTDMTMPVMDGASLVRALERLHPGLPIVCTSGIAARATAAEIGGHDFLPKPYTAERLTQTLSQAMAKAAGRMAA